MEVFSLENPVLRTYMIAASLMILKMLAQAYITVFQMLRVNGGFLNPEDTRKTSLNPRPDATQLEPNESVERTRRMHRNDVENIPLFLAAGLLLVLAQPTALVAALLMYGYVATRFAHFWAYATRQDHEVRATLWTLGTIVLAVMVGWALYAALTHG